MESYAKRSVYTDRYLGNPVAMEPAHATEYDFFDWELEVEDGSEIGGVVGHNAETSAQGLRERIAQLTLALNGDSGMNSAKKREIQNQLKALEGKINTLASLPPLRRDALAHSIMQTIARLEVPAYGLGDKEIDSLGNDLEDSSFTKSDLKTKTTDLQTKINGLFSQGAISQHVRDTLNERLKRLATELGQKDADLNFVGNQLQGFEETLGMIKTEYVINGKMIKDIEGSDGVENPALKALCIMTGKSEEQILEAVQKFSFGSAIDSIQDLRNAFTNNILLPSAPNKELIDFLKAIDPILGDRLGKAKEWNHLKLGPGYMEATDRVVELLKALYPDKASTIKRAYSDTAFPDSRFKYYDWETLDDFTFGGKQYTWLKTTQGTGTSASTDIQFSEVTESYSLNYSYNDAGSSGSTSATRPVMT